MAMASRSQTLSRLVTALNRPGVDGVLATPDVLEDLLLLGALEDKVVIGSMNRGGLAGSVWELRDDVTAYTAEAISSAGLNGGKMLTRIALDDPGTADTLQACAEAVSALAARGLLAMIEPFWSRRRSLTRVIHQLDPESMIRAIHVAQALGATSAYSWLKLPVVDDLDRVLDSTSLPVLLLGGDPGGDPARTYQTWRRAMALPNVRGLVVGRALLWPADHDVAAAVDTAAGIVHPT
jgi:DhnA family fructose-bisphosphate aldolase class Ia